MFSTDVKKYATKNLNIDNLIHVSVFLVLFGHDGDMKPSLGRGLGLSGGHRLKL